MIYHNTQYHDVSGRGVRELDDGGGEGPGGRRRSGGSEPKPQEGCAHRAEGGGVRGYRSPESSRSSPWTDHGDVLDHKKIGGFPVRSRHRTHSSALASAAITAHDSPSGRGSPCYPRSCQYPGRRR